MMFSTPIIVPGDRYQQPLRTSTINCSPQTENMLEVRTVHVSFFTS